MNNVSLILSVLLTVTLALIIAPNILAMNRGKVLRNIALWLAIMLALALVYQNFGPGKDQRMTFTSSVDGGEDASNGTPPEPGDQGFIPPRE